MFGSSNLVFAQVKEIKPYAVTANKMTLAKPATLEIDPDGITMLAPNLGEMSTHFQPVVKNYMILWCSAKQGDNQVEWTVKVPADGISGVTASVDGKGSQLTVSSNGQKQKVIITEAGSRYGDKLDGWWFDGGEGKKSFHPSQLKDGVFTSRLQQSLQAHGCFPLEKRWGHIDLNSPIAKPKYSAKQLISVVKQARKSRYPSSINLEMYEDGSVSPASYSLLKQVNKVTSR